MTRTELSRIVDAPASVVFSAIADVSEFSKAVPHIEHVEFLSETRTGVGTRFRETRRMGGRKAATVLEVTEYVRDQRVRFVADEGGTVWDTTFTVEPDPEGRGTRLGMVMEARPHRLVAKLLAPLMRSAIAKAIADDLDAVKAYAETTG